MQNHQKIKNIKLLLQSVILYTFIINKRFEKSNTLYHKFLNHNLTKYRAIAIDM